MKDEQNQVETIFNVGAEGGSIYIKRRRNALGDWKFAMTTNESAMEGFLDDDDQVGLIQRSPTVATFEEALGLMNKYPWHRLKVLFLHPEYQDIVEVKKQKRLSKDA